MYKNKSLWNIRIFLLKWVMLPYGLEDGLSVLGRLQSDLLADDVSVLSLHTRASFRLRLHAQHLVLVPQLHLVLDGRYGNTHAITLRRRRTRVPALQSDVGRPHLSSWLPASAQTLPVCAGSPRSTVAVEEGRRR